MFCSKQEKQKKKFWAWAYILYTLLGLLTAKKGGLFLHCLGYLLFVFDKTCHQICQLQQMPYRIVNLLKCHCKIYLAHKAFSVSPASDCLFENLGLSLLQINQPVIGFIRNTEKKRGLKSHGGVPKHTHTHACSTVRKQGTQFKSGEEKVQNKQNTF